MYSAEGSFDPRYFTFMKVNPSLPERVPDALRERAAAQGSRLRIIHEAQLPRYRPELQQMGFLESSCQYHVAANREHTYAPHVLGYEADYIGFVQYDMKLPEGFVGRVARTAAAARDAHISLGDINRYVFDWAGGPGSHAAGWMLLPFNRRDAWMNTDEGAARALAQHDIKRAEVHERAPKAQNMGHSLQGLIYNATLGYIVEAFNSFERGASSAPLPLAWSRKPRCMNMLATANDTRVQRRAATLDELLRARRVNLYNAYLLPVDTFERMLRWSRTCFFEQPEEFARAVSTSSTWPDDGGGERAGGVFRHGIKGVQWGHLGGMMERAHATWMALALNDASYVAIHVEHVQRLHSFSPFHPEAWSIWPLLGTLPRLAVALSLLGGARLVFVLCRSRWSSRGRGKRN
eukprot:g1949.t1